LDAKRPILNFHIKDLSGQFPDELIGGAVALMLSHGLEMLIGIVRTVFWPGNPCLFGLMSQKVDYYMSPPCQTTLMVNGRG
jgi:hypothetical protein